MLVYQRVYIYNICLSICLKVMNQFRKPRVVKDNFTTPRAVVSLRFFNCFRLLLEKAPRRRNYDNLADLMVISLEFNAMNWHLMVMLYPGDLRNITKQKIIV